MLRIHEFAVLCGSNVHTLRYYDKIGLLKPAAVCVDSGYRFYREEQLNDYILIKRFQRVGFSVEDIKKLHDLSDREIVAVISNKIEEINFQIGEALKLKEEYEERCLLKSIN